MKPTLYLNISYISLWKYYDGDKELMVITLNNFGIEYIKS